MPNSAETVENLARRLEWHKILADLKECETLEDLQKLVEKYTALCENDK